MSNDKTLVDRILFVDGQLSQAEHLLDSLSRQLAQASVHLMPGLGQAVSDARIRRGRCLARRNRLIDWHNYLFPETGEIPDVKGGDHE